MRDLTEQFYGEFKMASWITDSLNKIPLLIDKQPLSEKHPIEVPRLWLIGPLGKDKDKNLHLYAHNEDSGSFCRRISSINPIKDTCHLHVLAGLKWYKLDANKSAFALTKTISLLLRGAYTDVPLIHPDEIYDRIDEC